MPSDKPIRLRRARRTALEKLKSSLDLPLVGELEQLFDLDQHLDFSDFPTLLTAVVAATTAAERLELSPVDHWPQAADEARQLLEASIKADLGLSTATIAPTGRWPHALGGVYSNTLLDAFLMGVDRTNNNKVATASLLALLWAARLSDLDRQLLTDCIASTCRLSFALPPTRETLHLVLPTDDIFPATRLLQHLTTLRSSGGKSITDTVQKHLANLEDLCIALLGEALPPPASNPPGTKSTTPTASRSKNPIAGHKGFTPPWIPAATPPLPGGYQLRSISPSTLPAPDEADLDDPPPQAMAFVEGPVDDASEQTEDVDDGAPESKSSTVGVAAETPDLINSAEATSRFWLRRVSCVFPHHHSALQAGERAALIAHLAAAKPLDPAAGLVALSLATSNEIADIAKWTRGPKGELTPDGHYRRNIPRRISKQAPTLSPEQTRGIEDHLLLALPRLAANWLSALPLDTPISAAIGATGAEVDRLTSDLLASIPGRRAYRISKAQIRFALPHVLFIRHRDSNLVYLLTGDAGDEAPVSGWYSHVPARRLQSAYDEAIAQLFQ